MNWWFLAFAVGGYLLGSIPFGVIVGRLVRGVDIREYGSGKMGMTNSLRTLGVRPAIVVLVCDALKGILPVLLARLLTDDARVQVVGALAAIVGHDWPIYVGFRGGRGVTTSFGAMLAMMPLLGVLVPAVAGVVVYRTRYMSLMSISGTTLAAVLIVVLAVTGRVPGAYAGFAVVAGALIFILHRDNLARLLSGTEPKIGEGGHKRSSTKKYASTGGPR